jgi:cardiolipin synthase
MHAEQELELLAGGAVAFPRMLAAIETAEKRIRLEVYRFRLDQTGEKFLGALGAAARRGVEVAVVVDGWGSLFSGRAVVQRLRSAGCQARVYNRFLGMFLGHLRRNHRKLLLIDDRVVFLGGLNISDEQTGPNAWADLAVRVAGPATARLAQVIRNEHPTVFSPTVRLMVSKEGGGRRLRRSYLKAIGSAERSVVMAQAYFLPDRRVLRTIRAAAQRGAAVTLLLPGHSDVPLARAAMRWYCRRLLAPRIRVLEWPGGVLHAKAASVDGRLALLGSFNLDPYSGVNLEVLAEIHDVEFAAQLEAWIQVLVDQSLPIPPKASRRWPSILRERFAGWGSAFLWMLVRGFRARSHPRSRPHHRPEGARDEPGRPPGG